MSKDWTPKEFLLAEKEMFERYGTEIPKMREHNFVMTNFVTGNTFPMYNEDDWKVKRNFDNTGFLFDNFLRLYKNHHTDKDIQVYNELERVITEIVNDVPVTSSVLDVEIIRKWFKGELDTGFYYNTYNNQLLEEYILKILGVKEDFDDE